ncbi:MAG: AbrB/MazE/SpoVT family DNA-binding domain-containing protein [bacterium]|nr:AbrB/MazE/SpoVT family DNA-binding domain-containing protein [bacterium]
MQSVITSKFQTTIPKDVRERLKLSVHDTLEWKIDRGKIVVLPVQKKFLKYRNKIKTGPGKIGDDIKLAHQNRLKKFLQLIRRREN